MRATRSSPSTSPSRYPTTSCWWGCSEPRHGGRPRLGAVDPAGPAGHRHRNRPGQPDRSRSTWLSRRRRRRPGGSRARGALGGGLLGAAAGRVIAQGNDLSVLELDAGPGSSLGSSTVQRSGRGEPIAVESIAGLEAPAWAGLLRDVPPRARPRRVRPTGHQPAPRGHGYVRGTRTRHLLAACCHLGLCLIVGPVNLMVLRRIGRRELAWVTVPVISVLAVAGFLAGWPEQGVRGGAPACLGGRGRRRDRKRRLRGHAGFGKRRGAVDDAPRRLAGRLVARGGLVRALRVIGPGRRGRSQHGLRLPTSRGGSARLQVERTGCDANGRVGDWGRECSPSGCAMTPR